jgi:hypothetical protein
MSLFTKIPKNSGELLKEQQGILEILIKTVKGLKDNNTKIISLDTDYQKELSRIEDERKVLKSLQEENSIVIANINSLLTVKSE